MTARREHRTRRRQPAASPGPHESGQDAIVMRPATIERVGEVVASELGRVAVPNGGDATWSLDAHGRLWVAKEGGCEEQLAEAIWWLFGERLGARQRVAATGLKSGVHVWLSEALPNVVHWSPAETRPVTNLTEVGTMLALDALLMNSDRHAGNVLVELDGQTGVRLWAIDAGASLAGWPADFAAIGSATPRLSNHAWGLPVVDLAEHASRAAERARDLTADDVSSIAAAACALVREPDHAALATALNTRIQNATSLVNDHLRALIEREATP